MVSVKQSVLDKYKDSEVKEQGKGWQNLVTAVNINKKKQQSLTNSPTSSTGYNNSTNIFSPNVDILSNGIDNHALNLRVCNNCNKPVNLRCLQKHLEFCTNPKQYWETKILAKNTRNGNKKNGQVDGTASGPDKKRKIGMYAEDDDADDDENDNENNGGGGGDEDQDDEDQDEDDDEDDDDEDQDDEDDDYDNEGKRTVKKSFARGTVQSPQKKKRKTANGGGNAPSANQNKESLSVLSSSADSTSTANTKQQAKISKQLEKKQKLAKKQEERALLKRLKQEERLKQQHLKKHAKLKTQQEKILKQQLKQQQQQLLLLQQQPKKLTQEQETHNVLTGISKSYPLPLENYVLQSTRLKTKNFRMRQMFSKCFNPKQGFTKTGFGAVQGRVGYIDIEKPNEYSFKIDYSHMKYPNQGPPSSSSAPQTTQSPPASIQQNLSPQQILKQQQQQQLQQQQMQQQQYQIQQQRAQEAALHLAASTKMMQNQQTPTTAGNNNGSSNGSSNGNATKESAVTPTTNVHQGLGNPVNIGINSPFQPK